MPGLITLARKAVVAEVQRKSPPKPETTTTAKPVFVTIERNGRILGCRGSLVARTQSLETEVIQAARSASSHDPRYQPMTSGDLTGMLVTVTVVLSQEPIKTVEGLSPKHGLVLTSGGRTGVVLPWEGKDPKTRLAWAYRKAGVKEGTKALLYRLVAERSRG
jgi:AMMECR1 domain-containing protein